MMPQTPPEMAEVLQTLAQSDALKTLEARLAAQNAFNLFDAIGVSNQELRHSDFLAFLLRPHEAHGLGDAFLKWFLHHALAHSPAPPVAPADLAQWDLSDANIEREWQNVDLFITSPQNHLAVVVENKIYTGEHDDQLTRYMATAELHGYKEPHWKLWGVYLTPHGGKSSHADYLPIGYEAVCAHLEKLCKTNAFSNAASPDVETTVRHYTRMLRRKIMGDPEITKLCHELYAEHKMAFDRVWAERDTKPIQTAITNHLRECIGNTTGFEVAGSNFYRNILCSYFGPESWSNEEALLSKPRIKWSIYLQSETYTDGRVVIQGIVAPCEPVLRTKLLQLVQEAFQKTIPQQRENAYIVFYTYTLRPSQYEPEEPEEQTDEALEALSDAWQEWAETEGPKFTALIKPGDFPAA